MIEALPNKRTAEEWMPWQWCNLRRNPFGELTQSERADLAVVDVDAIAAQVAADHQAVQFIGGCGRGKTTRMLALSHALPQSSYVYLPEDGPCPSIAVGRPILIDEAQRLPRRVRHQVMLSGLPLVLATHRDLARPLRRFGYTVQTCQIGPDNTPELLHELLNGRIAASCLDPQRPVPNLSIADARQLVSIFGSDVRQIESHLYDVVQKQTFVTPGSQHVQMRFID